MTRRSIQVLAQLVLHVTLAAFATHANSASLQASSGQKRVTLVELYTSEGCSSCPPAEAWMNRLQDDPRLWREIVPVAFHVDYWDYIGWPDRFALPAHSQRQREYRRQRLLSSVYTPGLVSNGREWRGWFRHRTLDTSQAQSGGELSIEVSDDRIEARYQTEPPSGDLMLNVALLGFDLTTQVKAGENHGRTLEHAFVVIGFRQIPMQLDARIARASGPLPQQRIDAPRKAIAAWVSAGRALPPLQATGGYLSP